MFSMGEIRKRKWPFTGDGEEERYSSATPVPVEVDEGDEVCFGSVSGQGSHFVSIQNQK